MKPDKMQVHMIETDRIAPPISVPRTDSTEEPRYVQAPGRDNQSTMSIPRKLAPELLLQRSELEIKPYMLDLIYQGMLKSSTTANQILTAWYQLSQHQNPVDTPST
jgi:hypothetical protein